MPRTRILAALLIALTASACERSPTDTNTLSASVARELAQSYSVLSTILVLTAGTPPPWGAAADGSVPGVSQTATFDVSFACPRAGISRLEGTHTLTLDPQTQSGSHTLTATHTDDGCSFDLPQGAGTFTLTGAPHVAVTSQQVWTGGQRGVQTLTQKGAFTWTHSGASGTCTVDLVSTYNPANHLYTVKGRFCGHGIDVTWV
jgi:hypothetical protein